MSNLPAKTEELSNLIPPVDSPRYRYCAENIALELANGATMLGTAQKYNLDRKTLQTWSKHPHFLALIDLKKNMIRDELLSRIKGFGETNWLPNAWILERNRAFQGEFAAPKAKGQSAGGVTINVVVGQPPGGNTKISVGDPPAANAHNHKAHDQDAIPYLDIQVENEE